MNLKIWVAISTLVLISGAVGQYSHSRCTPFGILAESEDYDDSDYSDESSFYSGEHRIRREASVQDAASAMGIVKDDLSSASGQLFGCCYSSFSCWKEGGICLPSWLKPFFSCSKDNLCHGYSSCTCFLPTTKCSPCQGSCGNGGTCKNTCSSLEVTLSSSNCSQSSNCKCCAPCRGTCGTNGLCKRSCATTGETDAGTCSSGDCRCCERPCPGSCAGGGKCKKSCSSNETDGGICPGTVNCRCCKPKEPDCSSRTCGRFGICRDYCGFNERENGRCPGSTTCMCCQKKFGGGCIGKRCELEKIP